MKKIIVHIGPHRTGSTSIQRLLKDNINFLSQSYYIPKSGQISKDIVNHANLCWELMQPFEKRFIKQYGTIKDLLLEIKGISQTILVSSEAFVFVLTKIKLKKIFEKQMLEAGYQIHYLMIRRIDINLYNSLFSLLQNFYQKKMYIKDIKPLSFFKEIIIFGKIKSFIIGQNGQFYFYYDSYLLEKDIRKESRCSLDIINYDKNLLINFLIYLKLNQQNILFNQNLNKTNWSHKFYFFSILSWFIRLFLNWIYKIK